MNEKNTKNQKKEQPILLKDWKITFLSEEKINDFSYELVETLFDFDALFLTDKSILNDFLLPREYKGHKQVEFHQLSEEDKKLYPWVLEDFSKEDQQKLIVDFPPITDKELAIIKEEERQMLFKLIEHKFSISMSQYPSDKDLLVWKVSNYIFKQLQFKKEFDKI